MTEKQLTEKPFSWRYCPVCGSGEVHWLGKSMVCGDCRWEYFHNAASAVGAILEVGERIVLVRRAREPGRGMLDLPGGFVDYDETGEEALAREVREELGIEVKNIRYQSSAPNRYFYKGVMYYTLDLFYVCQADSADEIRLEDEIAEIVRLKPQELNLEEMAFESTKKGLEMYLHGKKI